MATKNLKKAQYGTTTGKSRGMYDPNSGMNRPTTPMGQAKKGAIVKKKMAKGGSASSALKTFNDNKAMAYKKAGGAMDSYRKTLKKAQDGIIQQVNSMNPNYKMDPTSGAAIPRQPVNTPVKAGPLTEKDAQMLSTSPLYKDTNKAYSYFSSGMQPTPNGYRVTPQGRMDDKEKEIRSSAAFKKGGATKAKKFAALAPPYNKATAADRIAGAKKNKRK